MNEQAVMTLLDEPILLVSEKEQGFSSVMHPYSFVLKTPATKPLSNWCHRRSCLLKHLSVGYQLNSIWITY